jgi:hypothetical protein
MPPKKNKRIWARDKQWSEADFSKSCSRELAPVAQAVATLSVEARRERARLPNMPSDVELDDDDLDDPEDPDVRDTSDDASDDEAEFTVDVQDEGVDLVQFLTEELADTSLSSELARRAASALAGATPAAPAACAPKKVPVIRGAAAARSPPAVKPKAKYVAAKLPPNPDDHECDVPVTEKLNISEKFSAANQIIAELAKTVKGEDAAKLTKLRSLVKAVFVHS